MCKHRESTFSNHMNMYNPDHLMPLKPTSMLHETTQDATSKLWRVWDCSQVRENPSLHTSLVSFYFSDRAQLLFVFVAQIWVSFFFLFSIHQVTDTYLIQRGSVTFVVGGIYICLHMFFFVLRKRLKSTVNSLRGSSQIFYMKPTMEGRELKWWKTAVQTCNPLFGLLGQGLKIDHLFLINFFL